MDTIGFWELFRRKFGRSRKRDLCATGDAERQPAEPQNVVPYFCVTMLLRMEAEKREQDIAARKHKKADE